MKMRVTSAMPILEFQGGIMDRSISLEELEFIKSAKNINDISSIWSLIADFFCGTNKEEAKKYLFTLLNSDCGAEKIDAFEHLRFLAGPNYQKKFLLSDGDTNGNITTYTIIDMDYMLIPGLQFRVETNPDQKEKAPYKVMDAIEHEMEKELIAKFNDGVIPTTKNRIAKIQQHQAETNCRCTINGGRYDMDGLFSRIRSLEQQYMLTTILSGTALRTINAHLPPEFFSVAPSRLTYSVSLWGDQINVIVSYHDDEHEYKCQAEFLLDHPDYAKCLYVMLTTIDNNNYRHSSY